MSIEKGVFLKFTPDFNKLEKYGFIKNENEFFFKKEFFNNLFCAKVTVGLKGTVNGRVTDIENGDEYLPLRLENQEGAFVGEVRDAYTSLLTDIRNNCFNENFFISKQGNRISELIYEKYGDKPAFLWEESPDCGVFKNPTNNKWYGIIMHIERTKLNEPSKDKVEIINVKLDKDKIPEMINKKGFYPAYHMNKVHWITITLDDTLKDKQILDLIKESHAFTEKKTKKSTL